LRAMALPKPRLFAVAAKAGAEFALILIKWRGFAARFSCRIAPNMVSPQAETTGFCLKFGQGRKGGVQAAL